ncbi:MAG: DUF695 domain-containing protein [Campylobacteraceae bacterium]
MGLLKNIFGAKEKKPETNQDFWDWFVKNESEFYEVVKNGNNIEKNFFDKMSPKLSNIKEGIFFLTGMSENKAELILSADGNLKNIAFVEELVDDAPSLKNWTFIAHKPSINMEDFAIRMGGFEFNTQNLMFVANYDKKYPDEINITVIHKELNEENRPQITNGVYIYLDNFLGELTFAKDIDVISIEGVDKLKDYAQPISELKEYLSLRSEEFVEKYDSDQYDISKDSFSLLEAKLKNGAVLLASINATILNWDRKASHPWICIFIIRYKKSNDAALPNEMDNQVMYEIEDELTETLKDKDGYLHVGRETADGAREIYFACKDFRKPSKVFYEISKKYSQNFKMEYELFKDKYWKSLEKFNIKK